MKKILVAILIVSFSWALNAKTKDWIKVNNRYKDELLFQLIK
jgi:hypothetical protein